MHNCVQQSDSDQLLVYSLLCKSIQRERWPSAVESQWSTLGGRLASEVLNGSACRNGHYKVTSSHRETDLRHAQKGGVFCHENCLLKILPPKEKSLSTAAK